LENQFSLAHNNLNHLQSEQEHAFAKFQHFHAEEFYILNTQLSAHAQLTCFKKIHEQIYSKEYHFVEQDLCELEAEEIEVAKMGSNPAEVETADTLVVGSLSPTAHPLLLADPFFFDFSFSQLPDLLFYNTP